MKLAHAAFWFCFLFSCINAAFRASSSRRSIQRQRSQLIRQLFDAVASRNTESVIDAIVHGANPNAYDEHGYTPLIRAVVNEDLRVAQTLLDHYALINYQSKKGATPLLAACHIGNEKIVEYLLKRGADPNQTTYSGTAPVHIAATKDVRLLEILASHGADIRHFDKSGRDALLIAAKHGNDIVVELLLLHQVSITWSDALQTNAVCEAVDNGNIRVLEVLRKFGANLDDVRMGPPPIIRAVMNDDISMVRKLLELGANVDQVDEDGNTALLIAARKNFKLTKLMVDFGADLNQKDNMGRTAVVIAGEHEKMDIALYLVQAKTQRLEVIHGAHDD